VPDECHRALILFYVSQSLVRLGCKGGEYIVILWRDANHSFARRDLCEPEETGPCSSRRKHRYTQQVIRREETGLLRTEIVKRKRVKLNN